MTAQWIWRSEGGPSPVNTFTWFRTVVTLDEVPADGSLRFGADSTAQLWLGGHPLRRKVTRFHEPRLRTEQVDAAAHLTVGPNIVTVLHHNWGPITTFQRTQNAHAGLYLESSWLNSDESWRWKAAEEFGSDEAQFLGLADQAPRIRFPVLWNARTARDLRHDVIGAADDDSGWARVAVVTDGPWPREPAVVETPAQRESDQHPISILAAGHAARTTDPGEHSPSMLAASRLSPDSGMARDADALLGGRPVTVTGRAGETRYITVDFGRPIHGYPLVEASADIDADIDIGYGEIALSPFDGRALVGDDGWIDVDGVVAKGYADRVLAARERRRYELPDERTARWMSVHITFPADGTVVIHDLGIVKSQYPIEPLGSFRSGHKLLDQIVTLCEIHAEVTMSDAFVDTPGREDGQWIEDARPRAQIAASWYGDTRLRRLAIRTLAEGQGADGQLHPFFPSNFPAYPAPWDWSVQWIAMLYDDFVWHGDLEFLARHWPTTQRLWTRLLEDVGDDGIWRTSSVLGDIRNSIQPTEGASSGLITPWIIERLRWSSIMAEALRDAQNAELWAATAERMGEAFRRFHVVRHNESVGAIVADVYDPATGEHHGYGQAGQVAPLLDGSLDGREAEDLIDYVFPAPDASPPSDIARWNNPTTAYRVLSALSAHGHHDRALAHLLERCAPYLPGHPRNPVPLALQGPDGGPLPEYWISRADLALAPGEPNPAQPVDATGSHGWGCVPLLWLHESLLGVTFTDGRRGEISIKPVSAGLPFVQGTTVTPTGTVSVDFDPSVPRLSVEIPADCVATLVLPSEFEGMTVIDADRPAQPMSERDDIVLSAAGRYTFASADLGDRPRTDKRTR
ncbi:alpha-L-rhamnosidase-related protein [Parafrigoribacterium humi]|uniref:alpha-L-rhamnosidase-related protein n=1 Tax=Parafrigoribacterium humi TaxID=3144664 RepID=UPI0032EFCA2A